MAIAGGGALVLAVVDGGRAAERIDAHDRRSAARWATCRSSAIAGIADSANELLWERFGYGPAAIQMIKEHPIDGVGVGMFHALSHDFGKLRGYDHSGDPTTRRTGSATTSRSSALLGSIPMLWWCVVLAMLMFSRPRPAIACRSGCCAAC